MSQLKAYLETTIFNRYFEDGREYATSSRQLFKKIADGEIKAYSSTAVLEEIEKAPLSKRDEMFRLLSESNVTILELDQTVYDLADTY